MKSQTRRVAISCFLAVLLVLDLEVCSGFAPSRVYQQYPSLLIVNRARRSSGPESRLLLNPPSFGSNNNQNDQNRARSIISKIINRFDTVQSAGLENVLSQGAWGKIKQLHNPKTYLVLALLCGFKWNGCFTNKFYLFGFAFLIKWYRARYVFKIPVWDRQPNWNNIITSKEQEKQLRAVTCKTCGSTLFVAKSREFFFEGPTGIGGLGCFSCGAKGKDNFVNDRDRILEDVAEMDDYFDYERPLDFVTAAERRKLLKEASGDVEKANQLLLERTVGTTQEKSSSSTSVGDTGSSKADAVVDAEIVDPSPRADVPPPKSQPKQSKTPTSSPSSDDDDILDLLDMD